MDELVVETNHGVAASFHAVKYHGLSVALGDKLLVGFRHVHVVVVVVIVTREVQNFLEAVRGDGSGAVGGSESPGEGLGVGKPLKRSIEHF